MQEVLLDEGEVVDLEEWSSVMKEKMARFDDVADRLKSAISNVEKKEEGKVKHEENIILEEMLQEEIKIQEMKLQMKSKEYKKRFKIVNEERVNVWTGSVSRTSLRVRLTRLRLVL